MLNESPNFTIVNNTNLVNEGTGTNYGIEVTFERFLSKGFYFLYTTSLFESKYKGSDGIKRNIAFNSNYVINFRAEKELSINEKFALTFDGNITLTGGQPYTPIDIDLSRIYGIEIRGNSQAFTERYKNYFRLDFKMVSE